MGFLASFTSAMDLGGVQRFLLMLPLCLSIAVVYKTIRLPDDRSLVSATAALWVTIVLGMCAVGLALWILSELLI